MQRRGSLGRGYVGGSSAVVDVLTHLVRWGYTRGLGGFPPCGVALPWQVEVFPDDPSSSGGVHLGLRWWLLFMPWYRHWWSLSWQIDLLGDALTYGRCLAMSFSLDHCIHLVFMDWFSIYPLLCGLSLFLSRVSCFTFPLHTLTEFWFEMQW